MAVSTPENPDLGSSCPPFRLPNVNGNEFSIDDIQGYKALLVMFICNHCPYVQAIEDRLVELGQYMKKLGQPMIAICSNDAVNYPDDSFEKMKVKATQKNYPFPYLHDESQEVAKAFGAICTPDFFLYDSNRKLAYRGRLDDSWKDPSKVTTEDLKMAIDYLLKDQTPETKQIPSMGCSIKWKS